MLRGIRSRLTYANVMTTVAVFIALGGVSYAAVKLPKNSVGTTQIKKNAVTGVKVKDGSLSASDLSGAARTSLKGQKGDIGVKGDAGTRGESGAKGDSGARGLSAWDTIPSGRTVTGSVYHDLASAVYGDFAVSVALPARAPQPLTNATVNFAPDSQPGTNDDDPSCTGTLDKPTAPAGKVCIYLGDKTADASAMNGIVVGYDESKSTFAVFWTDDNTSSNDVEVSFSWAYTAP